MFIPLAEPLWRNWLARSAVTVIIRGLSERNRKAGGSSPPRGDEFFINKSNALWNCIHSIKFYPLIEQSGAAEACWAHNPEVRRSKLRSAIFFVFIVSRKQVFKS